jgi:glycosyltransferase involved in cell wall biosynthesis
LVFESHYCCDITIQDKQFRMAYTNPFVSIIIPAYNQAQYLKQSIDSAIAQAYPHTEIIVVNDGSTDETESIAKSYGSKINYIYQENLGLAGARNTGIRVAKGELIGLLDSDDIWKPNFLETIVSLVIKYPKASVFYSQGQCIDADGNILPQIVGGKTISQSNFFNSLLQANFLIPSTITLRRETIVNAGYFDETLRSCEDWDLWLRILPDATFIGTEEIIIYYRVHKESLTANISGMQTAKKTVVEKQFGIDDGAYSSWPTEKRLAYSGLYRYFLTTSIRRSGDWQSGIENLFKSLHTDPSRAADIDLFYELGLGIQPVGYRGSKEKIDVAGNTQEVINLINHAFQLDLGDNIQHLKPKVYGTAYYALGLLAYNTEQLKLSRRYLWLAGKYRPSLWIRTNMPGLFLKSILGLTTLEKLRGLKKSSP